MVFVVSLLRLAFLLVACVGFAVVSHGFTVPTFVEQVRLYGLRAAALSFVNSTTMTLPYSSSTLACTYTNDPVVVQEWLSDSLSREQYSVLGFDVEVRSSKQPMLRPSKSCRFPLRTQEPG